MFFVNPTPLVVYKLVKENEFNNRDSFSLIELKNFCFDVVKIAGENANEKYVLIDDSTRRKNYFEALSRLCDVDKAYVNFNVDKYFQNKKWADKIVDNMPQNFVDVMNKILQINVNLKDKKHYK